MWIAAYLFHSIALREIEIVFWLWVNQNQVKDTVFGVL
jgi:hypothetical protein